MTDDNREWDRPMPKPGQPTAPGGGSGTPTHPGGQSG
jgi:hypothetical protein